MNYYQKYRLFAEWALALGLVSWTEWVSMGPRDAAWIKNHRHLSDERYILARRNWLADERRRVWPEAALDKAAAYIERSPYIVLSEDGNEYVVT